jgi:dihydroorotate dehydrogenase (NAD+) catalytic subunit
MVDISISLAPGLRLKNPVMTASGTFGYGLDYEYFNVNELGAVVTKGTTLHPRHGHSQPRIIEIGRGLLNCIGLENPGVDLIITNMAPKWVDLGVPFIVNIAGETVEDYTEMAARLDTVVGISAIEVNISCPNINKGGIEFGSDAKTAALVTSLVRKATSLPIIVKLTPNVADIATIAKAVSEEGADGVTVINTIKGMVVDITKRKPLLSNIIGGLSGPDIKPIALAMVYQVASAVSVPVIGCGGISTAEDAIEFIMAGASAIQVGTATFTNPRAPVDIITGIEDFLYREGISDIKELIGVAQR